MSGSPGDAAVPPHLRQNQHLAGLWVGWGGPTGFPGCHLCSPPLPSHVWRDSWAPPKCQRAGQVWGQLLDGQGLLVLVQPSWCVYRHRELQASARRPAALHGHAECAPRAKCVRGDACVGAFLWTQRWAGRAGAPGSCAAPLCLRGTQATASLCDFGTSGQVTREQQAREGGGVWPSGDGRASHMVMCLLWGQNARLARRGRGRDRLTDVEQKGCNQTRRHNPPNVNSLQQYFSNLKWTPCVQTRAACRLAEHHS